MTEVAIELVRNASTRRPVGISNVLIVESKEVAINHLESGENVYLSASNTECVQTYHIQYTSLESTQFSDYTAGLDINKSDGEIITRHR